jgi:hypothetical protein
MRVSCALRYPVPRSAGGRSSCRGCDTGREQSVIDMAHITGQIVIHRPIDEVFDFVADERNEPRYNPQMIAAEQLTDGPVGPGTRFHAALRTRGRPTDMIIELVDYQRPVRLRSRTVLSSMDIDGSLQFDPVPEGTRMTWNWTVKPQGPLRFLTPLVAYMGRRQEQRIWTSLKDYLESRHPESAG